MLKISKKFACVALLGAGLVMGKTASADTITQPFTIPNQTVPFSNPFTFNLFDTTLGTLNSVTIFLGTSATAEVDIHNGNATPRAFTNAKATIPITATGPASITVTNSLIAGPFSGTAAPGDSAFPGVTGSTSASVSVPVSNFGSYEGSGGGASTITAASSDGVYSGSGGTGVFFGGSASASGNVIITYNYTPTSTSSTPEPGTWGLLVAGASTGLVLVRRRRRK